MDGRGCDAFHWEKVAVGDDDYRVYRGSWGWCVKRGDEPFRSRTLIEAFENALAGRADSALIRRLVDTVGRALDAEYARKQATVSTVVELPALREEGAATA